MNTLRRFLKSSWSWQCSVPESSTHSHSPTVVRESLRSRRELGYSGLTKRRGRQMSVLFSGGRRWDATDRHSSEK